MLGTREQTEILWSSLESLNFPLKCHSIHKQYEKLVNFYLYEPRNKNVIMFEMFQCCLKQEIKLKTSGKYANRCSFLWSFL